MKKMQLIVLAALTASSGWAQGSALPCVTELDRGGVTFDFAALSEQRFGSAIAPGDNLVKGMRSGTVGFKTSVQLPDADGGRYRVACRYTQKPPTGYRHEAHGNGGWRVTFDGQRGPLQHFLLVGESPIESVKTIKVPAGTKTLGLELFARKDYPIVFEQLSVVRLPKRDRAYFLLTSLGFIDGSFAVSPGQLGLVSFTCRKEPETVLDNSRLAFRVTLPKGVEFVDSSELKRGTLRRRVRQDGATVLQFALAGRVRIGGDQGYWADQRGILVRGAADLAVGSDAGKGRIELLEGDWVAGSLDIRFVVTAPVHAVKPQRYCNGFDYGQMNPMRLSERTNEIAYCRSLSEFGADVAIAESHGRADNEVFHAGGIRYVLPRQNLARNGYLFGFWPGGKPPEDIHYVAYPKTDDPNLLHCGICPQAVYGEDPRIIERVVKELAKTLDGADGMWANWEPCHYTGCFCDKCRRLFEKEQGLAADALKGSWPEEALKQYRREIDAFHSREHAKVVLTVDKWVRRVIRDRRTIGFLPGVEWADMSSCWRDEHLARTFRPNDYAGKLEWIEPWGPYGYAWAATEPYFYQPSRAMALFWGTADLRAQVDADYPEGQRPKLMAYPQGLGGSWIIQPEAFGMGFDSCFFNRWHAAAPFFFPMGSDARYWRTFAEATTRAARYESYVFDGRETTAETSLEPVAEFAPPCAYGTRFVPKSANALLLQGRSFDRNGTRIVAAFNFWEKGEAFFTLKARQLAPGEYRLVDETGILYAKDAAKATWSAEELARGVLVEVGAMRTRVFEIVPAAQPVRAMWQVTVEAMKSFYRQRQDELKRAAEAAREWERKNPTQPRDYMPMV